MDHCETLQDIASSGQAPSGPLRVNEHVLYVLHVLAPRLAEFYAKYPDIQLLIDMTDTLVDLIGSHADIAIRLGQLPNSEMLQRSLWRSVWKMVASPKYLDRKGWPKTPADLAQLEQVRFAVPERINILRFSGHTASVRVPPSITADNGEAVRQMVLNGLRIARFSNFMNDEGI